MKHWLKENWFKLSIVLIVFLTGLSVAYYFLIYVPEKNSLKRMDDLRKEEQTRFDREQQEKKSYIAKRKNDCFNIYDKEKDNWSNVKGSEYNEEKDICYVIYNAEQGEWKGINCDDLLPPDTMEVGTFLWNYRWERHDNCINKQFKKEF